MVVCLLASLQIGCEPFISIYHPQTHTVNIDEANARLVEVQVGGGGRKEWVERVRRCGFFIRCVYRFLLN